MFWRLFFIFIAVSLQHLNAAVAYERQKTALFSINGSFFQIETAKTPEEWTRGLMNRVYLKKQAGLLFYFPHESHITMWMKNTAIPLDIIWMDKKKRVVDLYHHAKPYSKKKLRSQKKAKYVLEINAGLAKLYNFKEGDQANFD